MFPQSIPNFIFTAAIGLFLMGLVTFAIGLAVLVLRSSGSDIRTIARQTTKMAQKGIAEDIAGLVGNAATLIDSLNQMVKTTTGIGIFLIFIGLLMIVGAYFAATSIGL